MPIRNRRKRSASASKSSSPVVKSGKRTTKVGVTSATVQRLERAGSSESAKIARDYISEP